MKWMVFLKNSKFPENKMKIREYEIGKSNLPLQSVQKQEHGLLLA